MDNARATNRIRVIGRLIVAAARVLAGQPVSQEIAWLTGGSKTAAGIEITPETAISSTAVLACVRAISETAAMLPLHVYRRTTTGRRKTEIAYDHPIYDLLHNQPNPEQTAIEFREMLQAQALMRGQGLAAIERTRYGAPSALWPMPAHRTTIERKNGVVYYSFTVDGTLYVLPAQDVLHIRGFAYAGLLGLVLPSTAGDAVGLALAQEQYLGRYYANNTHIGNIIRHPGKLSKDAQDRLKTQLSQEYGGVANAHKTMILEENMEIAKLGVTPKEQELISGRQFQISEVCRIFRMQPHMVHDLSRATFSNIEQQALEFVNYTLMPWLVRWEQRIRMQLFMPSERAQFYARHVVEGLLRGDSAARAEFYNKLFQIGAISINDIRDLEDMNPIEDGDTHFVPVNMMPLKRAVAAPAPVEPGDSDGDSKTQLAFALATTATTKREAALAGILAGRNGRAHG